MKLRILTIATVAGLSLSALLFAADNQAPNPMETMQAQRQVMQQQMQQIRDAKTPEERQQLIEAHRLTMQGFMQNMRNMHGGGMMGQGMPQGGMPQGGVMPGGPGGMMGQGMHQGGMPQGGMMNQGAPQGGMPQGNPAMMQQRMQMMENRMDAMQTLMGNMLEHQNATATLDTPAAAAQ